MAQSLGWAIDELLDQVQVPGVVANQLLQAVRYARSSTKSLLGAANLALAAEEIERQVSRSKKTSHSLEGGR